MEPTLPKKGTQYRKVLDALIEAEGDWVNKQVFCRGMWLTQAGYVIHTLENRYHWPIEHSTFTDDFGFKSYRLPKQPLIII